MGTRADFYIGRGPQAEWLGSIAWDGYPDGIPDHILGAQCSVEYRKVVTEFISNREDGTPPEDGWPWPWDDSGTTDYAYAFDSDQVWASCFGRPWQCPSDDTDPEDVEGDHAVFPDMSKIKNVQMGPRSGLIVIQGGRPPQAGRHANGR